MRGRVDVHARPQKAPAADAHLAHVQDHAVEIGVNAIAQVDVVSVVTVKRRLHHRLSGQGTEQLLQ